MAKGSVPIFNVSLCYITIIYASFGTTHCFEEANSLGVDVCSLSCLSCGGRAELLVSSFPRIFFLSVGVEKPNDPERHYSLVDWVASQLQRVG